MTKATILLAAVLLVCLCAGCQQKFTRQQYETIYVGMPDWQVRNVLGQATVTHGDAWAYVNESPYYRATIEFENSHVTGKRWSSDRFADQSDSDQSTGGGD